MSSFFDYRVNRSSLRNTFTTYLSANSNFDPCFINYLWILKLQLDCELNVLWLSHFSMHDLLRTPGGGLPHETDGDARQKF